MFKIRLFRCQDSYYIDSPDQLLFQWANSENEALFQCYEYVRDLDIYDGPEEAIQEWEVEEIFPPKEHHVFAIYDRDSPEDCFLFFVPYYISDIQNFIFDEIGDIYAQSNFFRGITIPSLFERFAIYDEENRYFIIGDTFIDKVEDFFMDEPGLSDVYIEYFFTDDDEILDDDFYKYVGRKLARDSKYVSFIVKEVRHELQM